jgi:hypothetical protein
METRKLSLQSDYLAQEIYARYSMQSRIKDGKSNFIIDTVAPYWIYTKLMGNNLDKYNEPTIGDTIPATSYAISAYFADLFRVPQIHISELVGILGYKMKDINSLMHKVQKKKLDIVLTGLGGGGSNFTYWLTELCGVLGKQNLFQSLTIYETEDVEYSNILRFPKNVLTTRNGSTHKLHTLTNERILAREINLCSVKMDQERIDSILESKPDTIFYGGGSVETAEFLNKYNFISATHGNTVCTLLVKPVQDSRIQMESYGVIQLAPFFMNQLRMAIGAMEFLAQDEIVWETNTFLEYDFTLADTKRDKFKYNWQFSTNNSIGTEHIVDEDTSSQESSELTPESEQ